MSSKPRAQVCPGCGARIRPGADRCELCGSELFVVEDEASVGTEIPESPPVGAGVCAPCGRANRPDAFFCDQCATPLEQSSARDDQSAQSPERAIGKRMQKPRRRAETTQVPASGPPPKSRVGLLLGAGVLGVAILYGITVVSKSVSRTSEPEPETRQVGADLSVYFPEDDGLADLSRPIRSAAEEATDPVREMSLRQELTELFVANGRLDLAGREQSRVGELENSASSWALAGNLHFDWMEQQSGPERVRASKRASAAYLKSLELEPGDLDVRTDLGVAFLNDPANPMAALRETNAVLEADSNHVQANFNKGVMLAQIGRNDQATRHFEKVASLTEPGSAAHDRATAILEQIQSTPG